MTVARKPEELEVWQLCNELAQRMRPVVDRAALNRWPDLRQQLDRASESPAPNVAEGFARFYPRDNARFVRIALGSLAELLNHLSRARARGVITLDEEQNLRALVTRARKAALSYHRYLKTAQPPEIRPRANKRPNKNPERRTEP
jgi:four helix bundle protein